MKSKIKILIAEDHGIVRKAIISFLHCFPDFLIVGEAENGKEIIQLLKYTKPDIIILDLEMPVMSGVEVLKIIKKEFSDIKVIILSMHVEEALIVESIINGANGYVSKNEDMPMLITAIREVNDKDYYFKQNISAEIIKELKYKSWHNVQSSILTKREIEVLNLICQGKSHKQIAENLNIVVRTVDFHKANLYKKTKTNSIAGLCYYAIKYKTDI